MWSSVEGEQSEEVGSLAVSPRGIHGRAEQPTGLGFRRSADSSTEELYDKTAGCTLRPGRFLIRGDLILGSTLAPSLSSAHRHDTGRTAKRRAHIHYEGALAETPPGSASVMPGLRRRSTRSCAANIRRRRPP
jgi:hypothetical protein